MEHIRGLKEVSYVEQNQVVYGEGYEEQKIAPWGLVRTTKHDLDPTDHTYKYNSLGEGQHNNNSKYNDDCGRHR